MAVYLLAWLLVLLNSLVWCDGIKCMQCRDVPHPEMCGQVTECSSGEVCLVREYATTSGLLLYTSDCIGQQRCVQIHKRNGWVEDSGSFDLDLCLECCNSTDYCNIEGCGTKVTSRQQRGPYCYDCSAADSGTHACRNVRRCDIGHFCDIEQTSFPGFYRSGCRPEKECDAITRAHTSVSIADQLSISLPYCCKDDFCNDILKFVYNDSSQVDGAWSSWGTWSACSASCSGGNQYRTRSCDNPSPRHGGSTCQGLSRQVQLCDQMSCPVDGAWSSWGTWSACSASCSGGSQYRTRSCDNPSPRNGGSTCPGPSRHVQFCNKISCPVEGGWSTWTQWSHCSGTCGRGNRTRYRHCNSPAPQHNGTTCSGAALESHECGQHRTCAVDGGWSSWTPWSLCSVTCGVGKKSRHRGCVNPVPQHNGALCTGEILQTQDCQPRLCSIGVHGVWFPWGQWSGCTVTCGRGFKTRQRVCNNPPPHCQGQQNENKVCTMSDCPGDVCGSLGKDGFSMVSNEGHRVCITLSRKLKTWQDARTRCIAEGGDLAIVNNRKMDGYVKQMLEGHISPVHENAWIGLSTTSTDHSWHWVDPALKLHFDNFHHGEASHTHHRCALAHLETRTYNWRSVSCNQTHPYLCEFK